MKKKMVIVNQTDIWDCGPCSVSSVVMYYDGFIPLEKIREDTFAGKGGTTVYHLVMALKSYGFDATAKKYEQNTLPNIYPSIAHVHYENGLDHYMVLYELSKEKIILMDPAKGKVTLTKEEFFKISTGIYIEMFPRSSIVQMEKGTTIIGLFLNIIKSNKKLCSKVLVCSMLTTIFTLLASFYFKVSYNLIESSSDKNVLIFVSYLFLFITILKVTFDYYKNYYKNHINKNIDVSIFKNFLDHIFHLPLKVINSHSSGEIISRINEIGMIKDAFSEVLVNSILEIILSIFSIVTLFLVSYRLAIILLFIISIYILITLIINPYIYKRIKNNIDYETSFNANLLDNIHMISSIKNLSKESYSLGKLEESLSKLLKDNYTFVKKINLFEYLKNFLIEGGTFLTNLYGFYLIYEGRMNIIDLVTFNTLMYYFIDPVKSILTVLPKFNYLKASFHKINDLMDLPIEEEGEVKKYLSGDIVIENLSFSYNNYYQIIKNLNLKIGLGEKVIIKGKSGTGKSTLCEILCGINQNYEGSILINDVNMKDINLPSLHKLVTYVGQRENLYTDTIKNNVLLNEDDTNFQKVCQICMIEDIVSKKKFRYEFGIDNNFGNISGGEKQRIVLARALIKCGDILILDEALSELDYHLEKKIIKKLIREYPDKTIIYVSHKYQDPLFERVINLNE